MVKLCIQPEEKELNKYLQLADHNNFQVEIDVDMLKSNPKLFEHRFVGVHGSNYLSSSELVEELEMLSRFNILYVVYHDSVVEKLLDSFYLSNHHKLVILMENCSCQSARDFDELYSKSKQKINHFNKCIDTGHVNLSNDKDLDKWADNEVSLFHLNNNYGKDTHNSLYDGEINFLNMNQLLKSKYVSLEVTLGFRTYLKNIQYMIRHGVVPFDNIAMPLNHPIIQEEFIARVRRLLRNHFKGSLCFAFFYGSFVRKELNTRSDVDMVVILKSKELKTDTFYGSYKIVCSEYNIHLDPEYPFEIFSENDYLSYVDLNTRTVSKEDIADREELLFSFLDHHLCFVGSMKQFQCHRRVVEKAVLGTARTGKDCYTKSDLKSIVRAYVNDS